MEQIRAAGAGEPELQVLRAQVMALAEAEQASRSQLESLKAQVAQLGQREAVARAQLKEAQSLTRALQEKARLESTEAQAGLKHNLDEERAARAKAEEELKKAVSDLRQQRGRPDAEMETLRALFTDLMREEAKGRQRLLRLQEQAEQQEKRAHELQDQVELLRAQGPADPPELAELQSKMSGLLTELAEARGRAKAHADRAAAEVEWAQERAREATQAEGKLNDELFALRIDLTNARESMASERERRERAVAQLGAEVGELKDALEKERGGSRTEIAELMQQLQNAAEESRQLSQKVREQTELRTLFRDELKDERRAAHENAVRLAEVERLLAETSQARERAEAIVRENGDAPALRESLKKLEAEAEKDSAELASLRLELSQGQSSMAEVCATLERSEHERAAEAMRRQAAEDERDRATHAEHAQLVEGRLKQARAEAEIAALSHELKHAREAADASRREQERLRDETAALISERRRMEAELAALVRAGGDAEELSRSMARAVSEAEQLRESLASAARARDEVARELDSVRSDLAVARTHNIDLSMRLDTSEKWARDLEPLAASLTPRRAAALALEEGRFDEAQKLLEQELLGAPDDADLHLLLGRLHARRGREAAAEASLARAAELAPTNFRAPLELALVQVRRGLRAQARKMFREALRRKPDCAEARDGLRLLDATWMWRASVAAAVLAVALLLLLLRRM